MPANAGHLRDKGLTPSLGKPLGGGHGNPLQYSCLENPMDRGAWWVTVHGVTKRQMWLSMHACRSHFFIAANPAPWVPGSHREHSAQFSGHLCRDSATSDKVRKETRRWENRSLATQGWADCLRRVSQGRLGSREGWGRCHLLTNRFDLQGSAWKDYRMIRAVLEGPEPTSRRSIVGCSSIWRWERLSPEPDSPEVEPGMGIQVHTACWECLRGKEGRGGRTESPASLCPWLSLALAWPHRQLYNMNGTIFIPLEAGPVFYTHICRSMTGLSCRVCPPKYHQE